MITGPCVISPPATRCPISSYPPWRRHGNSSSCAPTCPTRCPCCLWALLAPASRSSTPTFWLSCPRSSTHPTALTSQPAPQPIKRRTLSCPSSIAVGRACLDRLWGRSALSMSVSEHIFFSVCVMYLFTLESCAFGLLYVLMGCRRPEHASKGEVRRPAANRAAPAVD